MHGFTLHAEIHHPAHVLTTAMDKDVVSGYTCQSIVQNMDGTGYRGEELCVNLQNVATLFRPYEPDDASLNFTFLVKLYGHDYRDRMETMESRLRAITAGVVTALGRLTPSITVDTFQPYERIITPALVAVMFVPLGEGCIVTSKT